MPTTQLTAIDPTLPRAGTKTERRWLSILLRRAVEVACDFQNDRQYGAQLTVAYLLAATDMPEDEQRELLHRIRDETTS